MVETPALSRLWLVCFGGFRVSDYLRHALPVAHNAEEASKRGMPDVLDHDLKSRANRIEFSAVVVPADRVASAQLFSESSFRLSSCILSFFSTAVLSTACSQPAAFYQVAFETIPRSSVSGSVDQLVCPQPRPPSMPKTLIPPPPDDAAKAPIENVLELTSLKIIDKVRRHLVRFSLHFH